ncbi:Uncharacterised protein [Mycobacterium tuberculosis]|nr:Uncharacterised protein [Mycobacterium tuberculosis]
MTQSSSVERLVGEIDEFGYTVVEDVLDADSVAAYLADTRRLERELPTVIANSTTVVKGLARPGHVPVDRVDHDWVRIDNLLLHGPATRRCRYTPSCCRSSRVCLAATACCRGV